MSRRIEFRGASGAPYTFQRLEPGVALRPIGVTYVVAEPDEGGWRLLGVGHTNNLAARDWEARLAQTQAERPAAELLIRLNINRRIREAEAADLEPLAAKDD
jgi:hypothetical protein